MKKEVVFISFLMFLTIWVAAQTTFYGPHLTSTSPWVNKIHVFNSGTQTVEFDLNVFGTNGSFVLQESFSVQGLSVKTFVMTQFEGYVEQADDVILDVVSGSFTIQPQSESLVPLLSFRYGDSASLSQFFLGKDLHSRYVLPNVPNPVFDWTGLAMMNSSNQEISVKMEAYRDGVLEASTQKTMVGYSHFVGTSDEIFGGLGVNDFDQLVISSNTDFPAPIQITGNFNQDRHVFFMGYPTSAQTSSEGVTGSYPVVDTNQTSFFNDNSPISKPGQGNAFDGQDAGYAGIQPSYRDNGDGTITDEVTGLMWQQDPELALTYGEALDALSAFSLAGYSDWRLPTIKELYSLIMFNGVDPNVEGNDTSGLTPFINTDYFHFSYGDTDAGQRIIDSQYLSSSLYQSTTMEGHDTVFGVNFADGRIKGYPIELDRLGNAKTFRVMYVRGGQDYGKNQFVDNGDSTVSDLATGLMWSQGDSATFQVGDPVYGGMNWEEALAFAENLVFAGHDDWRLPNAKELQSIVDYSRCPDTTQSAAIDPVFQSTQIVNENGDLDYPSYWTGTTHKNLSPQSGMAAVYVSFGRAMGYMGSWQDVHGAGAQRSDPKAGNPEDYPTGRGPQGDAIRIYNYVRVVRDID